jgi:hypothetical protein
VMWPSYLWLSVTVPWEPLVPTINPCKLIKGLQTSTDLGHVESHSTMFWVIRDMTVATASLLRQPTPHASGLIMGTAVVFFSY